MKTLIVGSGGREAALARRMAEDSQVFACAQPTTPTVRHYVRKSGGDCCEVNPCDGAAIARFAVEKAIDLAMVSSDGPLAAGVADNLRSAGVATVGASRAAAEIEWNKIFARQLLETIAPELNPWHRIARNGEEVRAIFAERGEAPVAVKPVGLTGGKGVKVSGEHLRDAAEARQYALAQVASGEGVIVEEKIIGKEFTLQCISDGDTVFFPPPTYDYPYRDEGDSGPGTGGMGTISRHEGLPFIPAAALQQAHEAVRRVVAELKRMGRDFNGVMNAGFFLDGEGRLKVIEFNARFGDPEGINIMALLDGSWTAVMGALVERRLGEVPMKAHDSAVVYLVTRDYARRPATTPTDFALDFSVLNRHEVAIFFAAAEEVEEGGKKIYRSLGTSRLVALAKQGSDLQSCLNDIYAGIKEGVSGDVDYRGDIGGDFV